IRYGSSLPQALSSNETARSFSEVRHLLDAKDVQYVIEEQPSLATAAVPISGSSSTEILDRAAIAFDYAWKKQGNIVRLRKRYSDAEDRPSFTAEELREVADQM